MSLPLRRSRRVRKPSTYNIGDIVKVSQTTGVTSDGRLMYRLAEGQSPSTNLWLVAFEDDSGTRDEEVYETKFGNLVKRAEQGDEEEGSKKAATAASVKKNKHASAADGEVASDGAGSSVSKKPKNGKGNLAAKKEDSKDPKQSPTTKQQEEGKTKSQFRSPSLISDCSSSASTSVAATQQRQQQQQQQEPSAPKVSAREQRRLRRQAAIDEQMPLVNVADPLSQHRKGQSGSKKRSMAQSQISSNSKKAKKEKEEVITVQLNTGVLYLYRGLNRRAVFVRKK